MEQWKPIKNHEGFYEISNTGKVKSLVNRYKTKINQELRPYIDKKGYYRIMLSKPIKARFLIHRLVAEHFIEKPQDCNIVNHIDNNPSNNVFTNLEWTTYNGNLQHAQNQGRLFEAQSKGGKTTAAIATKTLMDNTLSMIGNTYGKWTVIGLGEIVKYGNINRPKLVCKCSCGVESEIDKIVLQTGGSVQCKACSNNELSQRVIYHIIHDFIPTFDYKGYSFTGNSNNCYGMTTKKLKLEAIKDSNTVWVPYTSILKYKLKQQKDIVSSI